MKNKYFVFIVGPMGKDLDRKPHTIALKEAISRVLPQVGIAEEEFVVRAPDELKSGDIPDAVFHEIDMADLAIADISGRSPNVFYEIAFFNALGTPLIIFDLEKNGKDAQDIPFYWSQSRIEFVTKFDLEILEKRMKEILLDFFDPNTAVDLSTNPVSKFYNFPTIDISAATGLAVGYFDNFVRNILAEKVGALACSDGSLTELLIVRPEGINTFSNDELRVKRAFKNATDQTVNAPIARRGKVYLDRIAGTTAIDIPTPLYTLNHSPRFKKLHSRLSKYRNYNAEFVSDILNNLGEKMIDAFFSTLEYLIKEEKGMSNNWRVVKSVDLEN